jgi:prephenate dehydrogenase
MSIHFNKVVIVGVGLIGASLGLAGKKKGLFGEVVGVGRNKANLEDALNMGAVNRYLHNPVEACRDADCVVLATPVERILSIGKEIAPHLRAGAILTDVGSVKKGLVMELDGCMPDGAHFVGGHPIAGSEASGASASRADLFEGSRTILTPTRSTGQDALKKVRTIWEEVGSTVVEMDADEHDRLLAAVSHLPHMVAYALVETLSELHKEKPDVADFAAGGFRDITRIASSHPGMWQEICKMNKNHIVSMIEQFEKALERIKGEIEKDRFNELIRIFEEAREFRNRL